MATTTNKRTRLACKVFGIRPADLDNFLTGWNTLTRREAEIASRLASGKTNKQIVADAGCAEKTLSVHRTAIKRKLGVPAIGIPRIVFSLRMAALIA